VHDGLGYSVNAAGTVGGSVLIDPDNFIEQAALFTGTQAELITPLAGEYTSHVMRVASDGIALVQSLDAGYVPTYYLYENGQKTILSFGAGDVYHLDLAAKGLVSGTIVTATSQRAFRYSAKTGTTILNPLPSEPSSWGQAINNSGAVLGYSFVDGALERIGSWDPAGNFHALFVEGTPQIPTVSNRLLWNTQGLVVITNTSASDLNSYIVPRPGLRQNLADITDGGLPAWTSIADVNDQGDLLGSGGSAYYNVEHSFILVKR
jgi:hypothetical protein